MASCSEASSENKPLQYSVIKWSSYSANYEPSNIMFDSPADQASRWSSETNNPPQFLILSLDKFAILKSVKFGKYEKTHVCNLKRFKVFAGLSEDCLVEVLDSGLKNDHIAEKFDVDITIEKNPVPIKIVKIVPIQSWGMSFNFSVWYIELCGVDDEKVIQPLIHWYHQYQERETVRLCLKHFRRHHYLDAFNSLRRCTGVALEDPVIEKLYDILVNAGDYKSCEELIEKVARDGLFNQFVNQQDLEAKWSKIEPINKDGSDTCPGQRGGHQMVIEPHTETLYLFAGWDGERDLADFWAYHVPSQQWTCISRDTEQDGGPCARSCHKMLIDSERRHIFVLGKYIEQREYNPDIHKSDFYLYDIDNNRWVIISEDTQSMGGPALLYDHQMAMDVENQTIYVFGGKGFGIYSGLYAYHIPTNHWKKVKDDSSDLRSRYGHSMHFDYRNRKLYIFAGQRGNEDFNDLLSYDVDNDVVSVLSGKICNKDFHAGPPAGYTQRATLDVEGSMLHVLLGLNKNRSKKDKNNLKNLLWLFDLLNKKWSCLTTNHTSYGMSETDSTYEPVPRYGHQLVYDSIKKIHYLFGGNPGLEHDHRKVRLGDFWSLSMYRPSIDYLLRRCKFFIRRYHFLELSKDEPIKALTFLQNDLYNVVDHSNNKEAVEFQKLAASLFEDSSVMDSDNGGRKPPHFEARTELFEMLLDYFPSSMTQPERNLIDLVSFNCHD